MPHTTFNVKDFGATGDGTTLDSPAINRAIEAAAREGGGEVRLPPGTYLSFSIRMKSHITLHLEKGATLLAAGNPPPPHEIILDMLTAEGTLPGGGTGDSGSFYAGDTFGLDQPLPPAPSSGKPATNFGNIAALIRGTLPTPGAPGYDPPEPNPHDKYQDHGHSHWQNSLIWGDNIEDVAITGPGLIDGRGLTWNADPENPTGNKAIAFRRCRKISLRDFTVFRGGHFILLATGCDDITIDNLTIDTNRDGIDIDCCHRVTITRCAINSPNDDAIVLKSGYSLGEARACEDIVIRDCKLMGYDMGSLLDGTKKTTQKIAPDRGGVTGRIKFGTESNGGFKRVLIEDCDFQHCRGLALELVDGGIMEDVTARRITMRDITTAPLFVRLGNRARGPAGTPVGIVRRITLSHIDAQDADPRFASLFVGIPGYFIDGLVLENIRLNYRGGGGRLDASAQPPENEKAYPEPSMLGVIPAYGLFFRHVKNLTVRNVSLTYQMDDKRPPIILDDVQKATFEHLTAKKLAGSPIFLLRNARDIQIRTSDGLADIHIPSATERTLGE